MWKLTFFHYYPALPGSSEVVKPRRPLDLVQKVRFYTAFYGHRWWRHDAFKYISHTFFKNIFQTLRIFKLSNQNALFT